MKYYVVSFAEDYKIATCKDPQDFTSVFLDKFDCSPLKETWSPVAVYRTKADSRSLNLPADFPYFLSEALVLKSKALHAMREIIEQDCEILPLSVEDGEPMWVLNVLRFVEPDYDRSQTIFFKGTRVPMMIDRYVFRKEELQGINVFRAEKRSGRTIVSEAFYKQYTAAKLTGLLFTEVTVE